MGDTSPIRAMRHSRAVCPHQDGFMDHSDDAWTVP